MIALSVIALLISGSVLQYLPHWYDIAIDYHQILGYSLTLALIYRVYILIVSKNNSASWREFIPTSQAKSNIIAMLRFYVSFGRTPLPGWYAHNPFWLPLYLLVFLALAIQLGSGLIMINNIPFSYFDIYLLHHYISQFVFWFTLIHFIAAIAHDIKGSGSDISAMLNGFRIFIINKSPGDLHSSNSQKVSFPPEFTAKNKNQGDQS